MAAGSLHVSLLLLLGVVTVSDLRTRLIPDAALAMALLAGLATCALSDPGSLPGRALAGALAGGALLAAVVVRPGGMGLGDAKLAAVLGVYLEDAVAEALIAAFALGSAAGAVLVLRHGWRARRMTIPFAPFLALGTLAAMLPQP